MSAKSFLSTVHLNGDQNLRSKMLTTPKVKELQRPKLKHKLQLLPATSTPSFMQFRINGYEEMPSKPCAVCVTTFTMPVCLHGTYFVSFLLLTGRCYDTETSVILLLLERPFFLICLLRSFGEVIVSSKF